MQKAKGKILRIKSGYNPNSSSVGSDIPTFLFIAASSGVITVILTQMLDAAGKLIKKDKELLQDKSE